MAEDSEPKPETAGWVAAGNLGAAVGFLIGMSSTDVTGQVAATILGLAGAFLGLKKLSLTRLSEGKPEKADPLEVGNANRAGVFAIALLAAFVFGRLALEHEWLRPSVDDEVKALGAAGLDKAQALSVVIGRRYGIDIDAKLKPPDDGSKKPSN